MMAMELAKPQLGQLRFSAGSKRARNRPTFHHSIAFIAKVAH
jgi:hypothetical protein